MRSMVILMLMLVSQVAFLGTAVSGTITKDDAIRIAQKTCANQSDKKNKFVLVTENPEEKAFGWIFFCNTEKYLRTKDRNYMVPGLGPLIVDREGRSEFLSTAMHPSIAIQEYEALHKVKCPAGEYPKKGKLGHIICCPDGAVCD